MLGMLQSYGVAGFEGNAMTARAQGGFHDPSRGGRARHLRAQD